MAELIGVFKVSGCCQSHPLRLKGKKVYPIAYTISISGPNGFHRLSNLQPFSCNCQSVFILISIHFSLNILAYSYIKYIL